MNKSEFFNLPKKKAAHHKTKRLQTQIIVGNRDVKMSLSDSKTSYIQGTPTLYVEGDAQKIKQKIIWGGGGIYRRFVGVSRGSTRLFF
jgi:hypothetical protein